MAISLSDLKKRLKAATLDKTTLDERFVKTVKDAGRGYQIGGKILGNQIQKRVGEPVRQWAASKGPQNVGRSIRENPTEYIPFSHAFRQQGIQSGQYLFDRTKNPVVRAGISTGQEFIKNYDRGFNNLSRGISQRKPGQTLTGAWQSVSPSLAAAGGLVPALSMAGLGGGLGAGVAKLTGSDPTTAFGKGANEGFRTRAVTRFTDPRISKIIDKVSPATGLFKRQLVQRGVSAAGNFAEDEIISSFEGYKNKASDRALSLLMGASMAGNIELSKSLKNSISQALSKTGASKKRAVRKVISGIENSGGIQRIVRGTRTFLRNGNKFAGSEKTTSDTIKLKNNVTAQQLGNKIRIRSVAPVSGRVSTQEFDSDIIKKALDTNTSLNNYSASDVKKINEARFLLGNENLQSMQGAVAGVEPYQDEEGNWQVRYNPTKGMIGVGIMGGVKAIKSQPTKGVEADVKTQLDNLLNYPTRLRQMGYSKKEIDSISAREAKRLIDKGVRPRVGIDEQRTNILSQFGKDPATPRQNTAKFEPTEQEVAEAVFKEVEDIPESKGFIKKLQKALNPLKFTPPDVQEAAKKWQSRLYQGRAMANDVVSVLGHVSDDDGWKIVQYVQEPTPKRAAELGLNTKQYNNEINQIKAYYDSVRNEAIERGLDVKYLDNYINQVWKESPEEIEKIMAKALGKRPSFTKQRIIPTYRQGVSGGLTPRFTHPAQLMAHYRYQLERAVANKEFSDYLLDSGRILPLTTARKNGLLDWKPITAPLFPKAEITTDGTNKVVQDYVAPKEIAQVINNIFEDKAEDTLLSGVANFSKNYQNVRLTGGVPYTPINSFTIANMVRDFTAGRVRSPIAAFATSFKDDWSKRFFEEKAPVIKRMAAEGLNVRTNADYTKLHKNIAESKALKESFGDKWSTLFDKPTFERFMPQLEVRLFEDTYNGAIKKGMSETDASKHAAGVVRNFYGVSDMNARGKMTEDVMSTFLFAPRFREAMINFWGKNLKSINPIKKSDGKVRFKGTLENLKDPTLDMNRRFLVGTAITYGLYSLLNKAISGHYMHENKDGKELALEIPTGDGESYFVSFLPSIATVPRRFVEAAGALRQGDVAGAAERMSTFGSAALSLGGDILSNRTFYGGPIYKKDDPALEKLRKTGSYTFRQSAPGILAEPVALAMGDTTADEAMVRAMELPAYKSKSTGKIKVKPKENTGGFFSLTNKDKKNVVHAAEEISQIPQDQESFNEFYKTSLAKSQGFDEEVRKIMYDPTLDEDEKQEKIEKKRQAMYPWAMQLETARSKYPEKVFEAEIVTYGKDHPADIKVEDRAKWAVAQLEGKSDEEKQKLINRFWESGVLTGKSNGVAQFIEDNHDLNVWKYTGTDKKARSASGKGKKIKLGSTPTINTQPIRFTPSQAPQQRIALRLPQSRGQQTIPVMKATKPSIDLRRVKFG